MVAVSVVDPAADADGMLVFPLVMCTRLFLLIGVVRSRLDHIGLLCHVGGLCRGSEREIWTQGRRVEEKRGK